MVYFRAIIVLWLLQLCSSTKIAANDENQDNALNSQDTIISTFSKDEDNDSEMNDFWGLVEDYKAYLKDQNTKQSNNNADAVSHNNKKRHVRKRRQRRLSPEDDESNNNSIHNAIRSVLPNDADQVTTDRMMAVIESRLLYDTLSKASMSAAIENRVLLHNSMSLGYGALIENRLLNGLSMSFHTSSRLLTATTKSINSATSAALPASGKVTTHVDVTMKNKNGEDEDASTIYQKFIDKTNQEEAKKYGERAKLTKHEHTNKDVVVDYAAFENGNGMTSG